MIIKIMKIHISQNEVKPVESEFPASSCKVRQLHEMENMKKLN